MVVKRNTSGQNQTKLTYNTTYG